MDDSDYRTQVFADIGQIDAAAWNELVAVDADANPFLRHAFLCALQSSGCADADTGWLAQFVTLWRGSKLAAAVPLYAKGHSYGEYVFDWAWADAHERAGISYYPKWLVAVPFTPVAGTRLLALDESARQAALATLLEIAGANDLSSLHVLYATARQIQAMERAGMLVRTTIQYHWRNRAYPDFAAFLSALTQPKRKKIRAERRKVLEEGITLDRRVGSAITAQDWDFFLRCYESTYANHCATPYLNRSFFATIAAQMPENLLLVRALRDGRLVASALGIFDRERSALYGRYWGAVEPVSCLHFECCYYQMIEFAIEQGLQVFEGGAQGSHKIARGLDPVATFSAHWLRDRRLHGAVARFVQREGVTVIAAMDELSEHRALREHRPALSAASEDMDRC